MLVQHRSIRLWGCGIYLDINPAQRHWCLSFESLQNYWLLKSMSQLIISVLDESMLDWTVLHKETLYLMHDMNIKQLSSS